MKVQRLAVRSLTAAALAFAAALAACAAGPDPPGERAARPPDAAAPAPKVDPAKVIYVTPVKGAPEPTSLVLADAVAAAIRDWGRPAILNEERNRAGATIEGSVVEVESRGEIAWLTVSWRLLAPYGTAVAEVRQQVVVDDDKWRGATAEAINLLLDDASPRLIRMVEAHVGPVDVAMLHPASPEATASSTDAAPTAAVAPPAPAPAPPPAAAPSAAVEPTPAAPPPEEAVPEVRPAPAEDPQADAERRPRTLEPGMAGPPPEPAPAPPPASTPAPEVSAAPERASSPAGGGMPPVEEEGFVDRLVPNMDTDERRPGDFRPPAPKTVTTINWGRPAFAIRPVAGAPGNGNEALTAALKSALRDRDLTISDDPRQAGFVIEGAVDVAPPIEGRQQARIVWKVSTVAGDEVGKAVQENNVVAGTLDGEWGRVAKIVADAAVSGIQDLFGATDKHATGGRDPLLQLPELPDADLPEVPGRAPPPPGFRSPAPAGRVPPAWRRPRAFTGRGGVDTFRRRPPEGWILTERSQ